MKKIAFCFLFICALYIGIQSNEDNKGELLHGELYPDPMTIIIQPF